MISPNTLKLWKEACKRATPEPWEVQVEDCGETIWLDDAHCVPPTVQDLCFIDISRTAVPQLIAEVESLRSGYLTDEHGNEYVQVCILKERIREQEAEIARLDTEIERLKDALLAIRDYGDPPGDGIAQAALEQSEGI